jgi:hypothetical protein
MAYSEYKSVQEFKDACGYVIDNQWYPRVTKIVEIKAKPALYKYYGDAESYEAAKAATEISAKEGTLIHETVEKFLLDTPVEIPPPIAPAVNTALKFIEKNGIRVYPDYVERRVWSSDHRYAGTIDALAAIRGRIGVLDIKTSQSIYRDYNLQTSAYMSVLGKSIKNLETRWILRIDQIKNCLLCGATLRPKGGKDKIRSALYGCEPDKHEWSSLQGVTELKEIPEWREDFEAFLSAKKLWEWENERWLKQIYRTY